MIVGIPIIQLALFGYAINTDPKHLPTAVIVARHSEFTRSFIAAMQNSGYFDFVATLPTRTRPRAPARRGQRAVRSRHPAPISLASCCAASARRC